MLDGPPPDIGIRLAPPRVEAPRPSQNFTPLPEFGKPTMTEPQKYSEPIMTKDDKQLTDQLLAEIMKEGPKKPQEVISKIEKKIPQEIKKPQGFWAKIKEAINTFFKNLFR